MPSPYRSWMQASSARAIFRLKSEYKKERLHLAASQLVRKAVHPIKPNGRDIKGIRPFSGVRRQSLLWGDSPEYIGFLTD